MGPGTRLGSRGRTGSGAGGGASTCVGPEAGLGSRGQTGSRGWTGVRGWQGSGPGEEPGLVGVQKLDGGPRAERPVWAWRRSQVAGVPGPAWVPSWARFSVRWGSADRTRVSGLGGGPGVGRSHRRQGSRGWWRVLGRWRSQAGSLGRVWQVQAGPPRGSLPEVAAAALSASRMGTRTDRAVTHPGAGALCPPWGAPRGLRACCDPPWTRESMRARASDHSE